MFLQYFGIINSKILIINFIDQIIDKNKILIIQINF